MPKFKMALIKGFYHTFLNFYSITTTIDNEFQVFNIIFEYFLVLFCEIVYNDEKGGLYEK
ncbi:hypothetical protein AKG39_10465 [Acetobacterium bakii]|uniref:Uncharacterized protein n=1 Tax=Acetobacterium bakii TaxID=52689 RepID=A0A0L6TZK8_9FIRM|nr:hypothetical protein AKG39_10465 [Acetobacterium bakii]